MIGCAPTASDELVKVAVEPEIVAAPNVVEPSLKVTEPDGEEPPESVAVRVTDCPSGGDSEELESETDSDALPTVTVMALEVAPALWLSPPYTAVIVCDPVDSDDTVSIAADPETGPEPSEVAPS